MDRMGPYPLENIEAMYFREIQIQENNCRERILLAILVWWRAGEVILGFLAIVHNAQLSRKVLMSKAESHEESITFFILDV